ncbi:hypothetical protein [Agrococcus sp. SCSIO52902]|uniref:hypothetical protein n=1 Tax=Agrococcus sp. SCSIO52902 TaxID=2933290 RepID=UPI001FF59255|nr:hypothetical protein [Agrococcus sp. SCSIO52902]UOW00901.1 hypothetical protein MU522_00260 [Agrococcus sp. SCSIO52902]
MAVLDWTTITVDVLVPASAILVSTVVAVALAKRERLDNLASLRRERLLAASAPLLINLAQLVSMDPFKEDFRDALRALRAHIAVLRAALDPTDSLVSDWLALRHREGMHLWLTAVEPVPQPSLGKGVHIAKFDPQRVPQAQSWAN